MIYRKQCVHFLTSHKSINRNKVLILILETGFYYFKTY
jgi:hypothetical protein